MLKSTTWWHKKDGRVVLVSWLAVGLSLGKSQHFSWKAFLIGRFLSDFVFVFTFCFDKVLLWRFKVLELSL